MFLLSRYALPVWLLLAFKAYMLMASPMVAPQGATQGQAPYFLRPSYDQALANACKANDSGACDLMSVRHGKP